MNIVNIVSRCQIIFLLTRELAGATVSGVSGSRWDFLTSAYGRKTENSCELKLAACGNSGIMRQMELKMGQIGGVCRVVTKDFAHNNFLTLRFV